MKFTVHTDLGITFAFIKILLRFFTVVVACIHGVHTLVSRILTHGGYSPLWTQFIQRQCNVVSQVQCVHIYVCAIRIFWMRLAWPNISTLAPSDPHQSRSSNNANKEQFIENISNGNVTIELSLSPNTHTRTHIIIQRNDSGTDYFP